MGAPLQEITECRGISHQAISHIFVSRVKRFHSQTGQRFRQIAHALNDQPAWIRRAGVCAWVCASAVSSLAAQAWRGRGLAPEARGV